MRWYAGRARKRPGWAAIFADDLVAGCEQLFAAYGARDQLSLPISIPIDEHGLVLLRPEGPLDAPRVPATLHLRRNGEAWGVTIGRRDGGPMVIPGFHEDLQPSAPAALAAIHVLITRGGLDITRLAPDGRPVTLRFDEAAARALANALFITLRMKLAKAPRGKARNEN